MKLLIYITFFVVSFFTFSQNGKIEYNLFVELEKESTEMLKELRGAESVSVSDGAEKLSFVLEFKGADSKFYVVDGIGKKNLDAKLALTWSRYENITYFNTKEETAYYNNKGNMLFNDEEFVIERKVFDSWELKNEKKEIQGFACYKAEGVLIEKDEYKEKDIHKNIVAWYCPELPFSFGPNGYGGLPGLILELQAGEVLFGATKISLNEKIENIDSTKLKGKKITAEEYSKIKRERAGALMEGR